MRFSVWEVLAFLRSHNTSLFIHWKYARRDVSRPRKSRFFPHWWSRTSERHYLRIVSTYIHFHRFPIGVEGIILMWKTWKVRVPTRVKIIFHTCMALHDSNNTPLWKQNPSVVSKSPLCCLLVTFARKGGQLSLTGAFISCKKGNIIN